MQFIVSVGRRMFMALVAAFAIAASIVVAAPSASAATVSDPYFNGVTGKYEGSYSYIDCNNGCGEDGNFVINNVANGYGVRVRVRALVNGTWYLYLDRVTPDNTNGKFLTGFPPAGAKIHIELCTVDSVAQVRGSCTNRYTYNNYY